MNQSGKICSRRHAGARNETGLCSAASRSLALAVLVVSLLAGCTPLPAAAPAISPGQAAGPTAAQAPTAAPTAEQAPTAGPTAAQAPTAGPTAAQAPTAGPAAAQAPTAGPTAAQAPTAGPTAAQSPNAGPTAPQAPAAAPTAGQAPTTAALDCPGCPSMDAFCPNKPGFERCYSCMKDFQPIGEKGSCDRVCGDEVHVGSCSLTENAQLKVDYVWTCQYKPLNAGCCQRNGSCTDGSAQGACTGDGATWHRDACCSDIVACSGGCCKYSDKSCAGGVSAKACTMAANSVGWTLGSCPPYPDCIPEPATVLLVLSGLGAAGLYLRRRRAR